MVGLQLDLDFLAIPIWNPEIMGAIDIAFNALKEVPATGMLRAQLDLLHAQAAQLERQLEVVTTQNIKLQLQLENEQAAHKNCQAAHQELQARHAEDERIKDGVLFLKGRRTSGEWLPFCPKCRLPSVEYNSTSRMGCTDEGCTWDAKISQADCDAIAAALP